MRAILLAPLICSCTLWWFENKPPTTSIFAVGRSPSSVAVGDVNGDGDLDLVVANRASGDVAVLLGKKNADFGEATFFPVGVVPIFVSVGDLDQDGDLDIVTANQASNDVSILRGDGSGAFTEPENIALGAAPSSLTLGDLDGDGSVDIVASCASFNGSEDGAVVLLNLDGGFAPFSLSMNGAGVSPSAVRLGNIDGDPRLDIVLANKETNNVVAFLQEDGGFQSQVFPGDELVPAGLLLLDTDVDGDLDFVTIDQGAGSANVFLHGNDEFRIQPIISYEVGGATAFVEGDLNQDGEQDLVIANQAKDSVRLVLGNRIGPGFTVSALIPIQEKDAGVAARPVAVALGDLDQDGDLDIVTANQETDNVSVLLNANMREATPSNSIPANGDEPQFIELADINQDLFLDIIAANQNSETVSILLGDGTGNFEVQLDTFGVGGRPEGFVVGDFDNDSLPDIVVANSQTNNVTTLLRQTSALQFTATTISTNPPNSNEGVEPECITAQDLDQDGDLDIITGQQTSSDISVLINDGGAGFLPAVIFPSGASEIRAISAGDMNKDGNIDIIAAASGSNKVVIFLGRDATNGFSGFDPPQLFGSKGEQPRAIKVGDINGDSAPDIVVSNLNSNNVVVFLGDGDGGISEFSPDPIVVGESPRFLLFANLNDLKDSRLDIVSINAGANAIDVLLGGGGAGFSLSGSFPVGREPEGGAVGDINRDGHDDIVIANLSDDDVTVFLGDGLGGFLP